MGGGFSRINSAPYESRKNQGGRQQRIFSDPSVKTVVTKSNPNTSDTIISPRGGGGPVLSPRDSSQSNLSPRPSGLTPRLLFTPSIDAPLKSVTVTPAQSPKPSQQGQNAEKSTRGSVRNIPSKRVAERKYWTDNVNATLRRASWNEFELSALMGTFLSLKLYFYMSYEILLYYINLCP
jgi:hypothetical protein